MPITRRRSPLILHRCLQVHLLDVLAEHQVSVAEHSRTGQLTYPYYQQNAFDMSFRLYSFPHSSAAI